MMRSLRTRLFVGLTIVIVLAGIVGGALAYLWAYDEAIEMQDAILSQVSAIASGGPLSNAPPVTGIDAEAEVRVVELGTAPRGLADDRRLWMLPDGLHMAVRNDKPIRAVMRTRADGSRFAVTQRTDIRDEIAQDTAVRTLLPVAALVPCLLIVTAFVIGYSFKPMVRLAADLDARGRDDFREIAAPDAPSEMHPFLASINALVQRLQANMDQQKRFIADAAHELRTPITALSVQAENLDPVEMPADARTRLTALKDGMRRTRHLLEQLLTLARQEATSSATKDVSRLDQTTKQVIADLVLEAASRGIDLGFRRFEELRVACDPATLTSLTRNLVENAIKFAPNRGRVDVDIFREGDLAVFQVDDDGPGIPPAEFDRIFEPFFRGRNHGKDGSGLGLSIVKQIVDRHHGSIQVSNIDVGARGGLRVTVRLPAEPSGE